MRLLIIILIFLSIGQFLISCSQTDKQLDGYPHDRTVSDSTGKPFDSLTFYFPTTVNQGGQIINTELDTFVQHWYSSSLYAFKEPILYSFYQGHDIYRFLWLRSFNRPISISLHKDGDRVWLTTKKLNRQPDVFDHFSMTIKFTAPDDTLNADTTNNPTEESLVKANRHADIILNQTKTLSSIEWNKFESLLKQCNFWTMNPVDIDRGCDGAEWIVEGHLQEKYSFVVRWSPDNDNFSDCGKYLIELSGLKEEIY